MTTANTKNKNEYFRNYMKEHYDTDVKSFRYYKSKYKLTDEELKEKFGNTQLLEVKRRAVVVMKNEMKEKKQHASNLELCKDNEIKMKKEMDRHEARIKQLEIDCRSVQAWSNILTPTYSSLTKYPKIFDCYWADFKVDLDVENHKQIEAENRNKFVEEFNISHSMRGKKKPNYINEKMDRNGKLNLDHGEVYKTIDGDYVLMVSPYGECDDEEYAKAGWVKYYRCYNHCTANTYIQVVEKKQRKPKKVV